MTNPVLRKKRPWKKRLIMWGAGREHYLAFLRNLPMQGILLALTVISFRKLDLSRFDPGNLAATAVAWLLALCVLFAYSANLGLFIDNAFTAHNRLADRVIARFRCRGASSRQASILYVYAWLKWRRLETFEFFLVMLLLLGGATAGLAFGIFNMLNWDQLIRHTR